MIGAGPRTGDLSGFGRTGRKSRCGHTDVAINGEGGARLVAPRRSKADAERQLLREAGLPWPTGCLREHVQWARLLCHPWRANE